MVNEPNRADYSGPRRRLERAVAHRESMHDRFVETKDLHRLHGEVRRDGSAVYLALTQPCDPMLGAMFGDWLGAIRATLDHLFYQLAVLETGQNPPTRSGQRQFPVCRTQEEFNALFTGRTRPLHGFGETAINAVRAMQPMNGKYGPDGDVILWIHDHARIDRHRTDWEMGGRVERVVPEFAEGAEARVDTYYYADTDEIPPVCSATREFIPLVYVCKTEEDAIALVGELGFSADSKLELVDWYVDAHSRGVSANIRNDSLADRMTFAEWFLGAAIDSFESLL